MDNMDPSKMILRRPVTLQSQTMFHASSWDGAGYDHPQSVVLDTSSIIDLPINMGVAHLEVRTDSVFVHRHPDATGRANPVLRSVQSVDNGAIVTVDLYADEKGFGYNGAVIVKANGVATVVVFSKKE